MCLSIVLQFSVAYILSNLVLSDIISNILMCRIGFLNSIFVSYSPDKLHRSRSFLLKRVVFYLFYLPIALPLWLPLSCLSSSSSPPQTPFTFLYCDNWDLLVQCWKEVTSEDKKTFWRGMPCVWSCAVGETFRLSLFSIKLAVGCFPYTNGSYLV